MRDFNYSKLSQNLFSPDILKLISAIHEYKGKQELYIEAHSDSLDALMRVAKVQSTDASNRIEGIFTTDKRLVELMEHSVEPRDRNEEEIVGYRDVLNLIHESYDHISISPSIIQQLHRDLLRYTPVGFAGLWKTVDNEIVEFDGDGNKRVRFQPTTALETPMAIENLCETYNEAIKLDLYDPLLLALVFVFDFTCVHPFNDGNGRMSRLLTLLLLYRCGYLVGKYISIEKEIEKSKETYYESLKDSTQRWHEGTNDCAPFVRYMLGVLLASYKDFSERVESLTVGNRTKAERVKSVFSHRLGKITKSEIVAINPDISKITIERALAELLKSGYIAKVGSGRTTGYTKIADEAIEKLAK